MPILTAPDRQIGKHRVDLRGDEFGRHLMDAADALGVLRGQRRDHGGAVDAERGERLEVGLDAGAPEESEPAMVSAIGVVIESLVKMRGLRAMDLS